MNNQVEEQLFQILERAAQALARSDYTPAEADLDQAATLAKSLPGDQSIIMRARVCCLRGRLAEGRRDLALAARHYEETFALLEQSSPIPIVLFVGTTRQLSALMLRQNDQATAARLRRRAWDVIAKALPTGEPDVAAQAATLAEMAAEVDAQEAELIYEEALKLLRTPPSQPRGLLILLTRRAASCVEAGKADEALAAVVVQEALETLNALSRVELAEEADSLIILARMCEQLKREDDALRLYQLASGEKGVAEVEAEECYAALMGQAGIHCGRGEHELAGELYMDAARVAVSVFGEESVWVAKTAHALADCYRQHHQYDKATDWYKVAGKIWRAQFGELDLRYAAALDGQALSYDQMGVYAKAEPNYNRVLNIRETVLGRTHPDTVLSLYNLAELARVQNDYALAEYRFLEALHVEEAARGYPTLTLAFILNNLGDLYTELGRYVEAEGLLNRALAMRRELCGPESERYTRSLYSVATLKHRQGDYAAAGDKLSEARVIAEQHGWQRDIADLDMLSAVMQFEQHGGNAHVMASLQSALDDMRKYYGDHHHHVVTLRKCSASCLAQQHDWQAAREQLNQSLPGEDIELIEVLVSGTRRQVAAHLEKLRYFQSLYLSILLHDSSYPPEALETAYELVQRRKGIETRSLRLRKPGADSYDVLIPPWKASPYPKITAELDRLRKRLNRLRLLGDEVAGEGQAQHDIAAIERQIGELEKRLAQATPTGKFEFELFGVSSTSVSSSLQEESVLIEYVHVADRVAKFDRGTKTSRYLAFVLRSRSDEAPKLFDLGDASQIDAAIEEMRTALIDYLPSGNSGTPAWSKKARFLYNRLVRPLADELGNAKHLFIAPDGGLSMLSFELLQAPDRQLLIDRYSFSYLLAGWEAYRFHEHFALKGPPVVLAAADYNLSSQANNETNTALVEQDDERIDALRRASRFADLPNAMAEGEAVARKLGIEALTGAQSTESVLKQSQSPEIIHIATHGFYLPRALPTGEEAQTDDDVGADHLESRASLDDPLERTGLALAGVNSFLNGESVPTQAEDGILFASEIVDLDLRRTDLVTLAACQTGQGDIRLGEGVQGLRQAFRAAGCRSVVSALWSIPDEREFMELFYDQLLAGAARSDALYHAKRIIRQKYPEDPLYWGGIILDGDPGPLRRFHPSSELRVAQLSWKEWVSNQTEAQEDTGSKATLAQRAQSLFDQGRAHLKEGAADDAIRDFTSVLSVEGAPMSLHAQALYERAGLWRQTDELAAALADYDQLLSLTSIPQRIRLSAHYDRATTHLRNEDFAAAIPDYTLVAQSPDLPPAQRMMALLNRGYAYLAKNDSDLAVADFTTIIETKGGSGDQRFKALLNRANTYSLKGDDRASIRDVSLALELGEGSAEELRTARYFRALRYLNVEDTQNAVADLNILLAAPDLPNNLVATYLLTRSQAYLDQGDTGKAKVDSQTVLSCPEVDPETATSAQQILASLT